MDNNNNVRILEEYCASDDISLDGLREKLQQITQPIALAVSHFLHELCLNESVTHDMVQLVLDSILYAAHYVSNRYHGVSYNDEDVDRYEAEQKEAEDKSPSAESPRKRKCSSDRTFPIHLAASNVHCPNSVVELLAKSNPSAIGHLSKLTVGHSSSKDGHYKDEKSLEKTPLHCYLSRTSNLQLDTVKILVDLCPESLKLGTDLPYFSADISYFPIHTIMDNIMDNPEVESHYDILRYLISLDPTILLCKDELEQYPVHMVCRHSISSAGLVQILVDGVGIKYYTNVPDCNGYLPIHLLCKNEVMGKGVKLDVLRILIDANPDSLQFRTHWNGISLPIHYASQFQDPVFCKMLVDGYPDSLRVGDNNSCLPFHLACDKGSIETVKYLYEANQECINKSTRSGVNPLYLALARTPGVEHEIIKFLLQRDPELATIALPNVDGDHILLPLQLACKRNAYESMKLLFDTYPTAIYTEEGSEEFISIPGTAEGSGSAAERSRGFLRRQMYDITRFCNSKDLAFPLPHHRAVKSDVTLGVFKLLTEKLPQHEQYDHEKKTTLHLACEYGNIGIVKYLVQLYKVDLTVPDSDGNYPLHLACREGYCDIINSLLEANTVSVSIKNSDKKLPIELLVESDCDQDCLVYTEAIWRLLVASPPTF